MTSPVVSVLIPTHNRPKMLAEALASVRAQTFTDYEIIVVANGEHFDLRPVSRAVAAKYGATYVELDKGNLSVARNVGASKARGEWIAFLDDDDLWLPHKLERQIAEARQTGGDMIACDYVKFFPDGRESFERIRPPEGWPHVKAISHLRWWCPPSAVMVRKSVFDEVGGFDPGQRFGEDNLMWQRISWRHAIHQVDEPLIRYRSGHASIMRHQTHHTRKQNLYELRYWLTIRRDTPRDLRWALPSVRTFVLPRLAASCSPWFSHPHPWLRPRTRWLAFRRWLGAITTSR